MSWQGYLIKARLRDLHPPVRGRVLTDLADSDTHTRGRMYVQFHDGVRKWVDACVCSLANKDDQP